MNSPSFINTPRRKLTARSDLSVPRCYLLNAPQPGEDKNTPVDKKELFMKVSYRASGGTKKKECLSSKIGEGPDVKARGGVKLQLPDSPSTD